MWHEEGWAPFPYRTHAEVSRSVPLGSARPEPRHQIIVGGQYSRATPSPLCGPLTRADARRHPVTAVNPKCLMNIIMC
jgi:hypothetical protein